MGGLDGGAGGAGTKASTPAKTANLDQEKLDDQSVDMYGDQDLLTGSLRYTACLTKTARLFEDSLLCCASTEKQFYAVIMTLILLFYFRGHPFITHQGGQNPMRVLNSVMLQSVFAGGQV